MIESVCDWRWLLYALLAAAALSDIRTMRIPNALPLGVVGALIVALAANSAPAEDYAAAALSGLIGLGVGYLFFTLRIMGGGDGKLFAATACWFGASALLGLGLWISIAGLFVGLAALAARALRARASSAEGGGSVVSALKAPAPYGVAIALGSVFAAEAPLFG